MCLCVRDICTTFACPWGLGFPCLNSIIYMLTCIRGIPSCIWWRCHATFCCLDLPKWPLKWLRSVQWFWHCAVDHLVSRHPWQTRDSLIMCPCPMGAFLINTCRTLPSLLLPNWFSANTRKWYTVHGLKLVTRVSVICPGRIFCFPWGYQSSTTPWKKEENFRDPICRAGNASTQNCGNLISQLPPPTFLNQLSNAWCEKSSSLSYLFALSIGRPIGQWLAKLAQRSRPLWPSDFGCLKCLGFEALAEALK